MAGNLARVGGLSAHSYSDEIILTDQLFDREGRIGQRFQQERHCSPHSFSPVVRIRTIPVHEVRGDSLVEFGQENCRVSSTIHYLLEPAAYESFVAFN
jgi:hypothetical protein